MAKEGIVLTGFMGAGKSTAGPVVAEQLSLPFVDTDRWLETEAGITIPRLMGIDQLMFRKVEAWALGRILAQEPAVISTGGGIVSTGYGRTALRATGLSIVLLDAPFAVVADHVANDPGPERLLFKDMDAARVLYDERQPWYEETATHRVNAAQPRAQVVHDIIAVIS